MLYTEGTGMLEGSFSKESVELMIFLLWGSLQEIQGEGRKLSAKTHGVFPTVSSYKLYFCIPKASCECKRQGSSCN